MYKILGAGKQSQAVAYALCTLKNNPFVHIYDNNDGALKNIQEFLEKEFSNNTNGVYYINDKIYIGKDDIVISTLPFIENFKIAKQCIDAGAKYFDLGGHVQTSKKIAKYAQKNNGTVLTDLGLAPGLINILGQSACQSVNNPTKLNMFCGGLPVDPYINELNYGLTFSIDGLINKYFNECSALINGKIVKTQPMGDVHIVHIDGIDYEAFNTSGGAHSTLEFSQKLGIKSCKYQTLRYLGHSKILRFLKNDLGKTNQEITELLNTLPTIKYDKVLIAIQVLGDNSYLVNYEIPHDDNFTAMQRATGFSATCSILQVEDKTGLLTYEDINADELLKELKKLIPEI